MDEEWTYPDDLPVFSVLRDPRFWQAFADGDPGNFLDFHETVGGAPYIWLLGRIVLDFNYAEHQLKALLWSYLGDSFEAGHAVTAAMGSSTVIDVLTSSAKRAEENSEIIELIKFGGKCFDICRHNRNSLAHSITVEGHGESTYWVRASRSSEYQQSQMKLDLEDLLRVSKEVAQTASFLFALQAHRNFAVRKGYGEIKLPVRFPMPTRLKSREVEISAELNKLGIKPKHK